MHEEDEWRTFYKYCENAVPPLITVPSDMARVHFVVSSVIGRGSFRLEWSLSGNMNFFCKKFYLPKGYSLTIRLWREVNASDRRNNVSQFSERLPSEYHLPLDNCC